MGMENKRPKRITLDTLAGMMANSFAELRSDMTAGFAALRNEMLDGFGTLEKRVLSVERGLKGVKYKVDQLELKIDQSRTETNARSDAMRAVVGFHERRISSLEEKVLPAPNEK